MSSGLPPDPRFPPVQYLLDLLPWEDPQYIPPSPHNLPAKSNRPNQDSYLITGGRQLIAEDTAQGFGGINTMLPGSVPSSGALSQSAQSIRDSHHYANIIGGTVNCLLAGVVVPTFLAAPITKRNLLSLRNSSPGAQNLFIDFARQASAQSWLVIPPGGLVIFDEVVPQDDLYVSCNVAGGVLAFGYSTIAG